MKKIPSPESKTSKFFLASALILGITACEASKINLAPAPMPAPAEKFNDASIRKLAGGIFALDSIWSMSDIAGVEAVTLNTHLTLVEKSSQAGRPDTVKHASVEAVSEGSPERTYTITFDQDWRGNWEFTCKDKIGHLQTMRSTEVDAQRVFDELAGHALDEVAIANEALHSQIAQFIPPSPCVSGE